MISGWPCEVDNTGRAPGGDGSVGSCLEGVCVCIRETVGVRPPGRTDNARPFVHPPTPYQTPSTPLLPSLPFGLRSTTHFFSCTYPQSLLTHSPVAVSPYKSLLIFPMLHCMMNDRPGFLSLCYFCRWSYFWRLFGLPYTVNTVDRWAGRPGGGEEGIKWVEGAPHTPCLPRHSTTNQSPDKSHSSIEREAVKSPAVICPLLVRLHLFSLRRGMAVAAAAGT